ncbi:MAG: DUF559 domain-containing protein [Planctomycetaceae bacterium]|nr:DUF559 domain-containing protein [Planctomycetaceae bacterium]
MKRSRARSQPAIEFARDQRRNVNNFASTVWQWIRNRQIFGQKFRREFPIPPYTADFCCVELRLVIEIDGEPHFTEEGREHDRIRDRFLQRSGYTVLRIPGYDVVRDDGSVIEKIRAAVRDAMNRESLKSHNPSPPAPLPETGRGEDD